MFVDQNPARKFLLHSELLVRESEKILKQLRGPFREAHTQSIDLSTEDGNVFVYFVQYLYNCNEWRCPTLPGTLSTPDHVLLARLYALGERMLAPNFQDAVLRNFFRNFRRDTKIAPNDICDLLETACSEITERADNDDVMRHNIFCYAAFHVESLQPLDRFKQLLHKHPELGRQLILRVYTDDTPPGRLPPVDGPIRFAAEETMQTTMKRERSHDKVLHPEQEEGELVVVKLPPAISYAASEFQRKTEKERWDRRQGGRGR